MTTRRTVGWLVLLLAVGGLLAWGFWPRPVPVETAPARVAPLTVTVEEEGRTRVKDRFVITAPVAGYLRRIDLEVGDPVTVGEPLARIEPAPSEVLDPRSRAEAEARAAAARASLAAAREEAEAARAAAELARLELARTEKLRAEDSVSEDALDRARARARQATAGLRSAEFAVEVARFELDAARTALEYAGATAEDAPEVVVLRAPVAGRVLTLHRESEGVVGRGEALLELGDPHALEVEVDLLSADAVRVGPGTPVRFTRWGGERTLEGVVRRVEPVGFTKISALGVEEQRVWVISDLTSPRDQWAALGDGYRVEASFVVWHDDAVLQVPTSALFRHGEGWAVFRVADGRARRTPVEVGRRSGLVAQITEGLPEGAPVITHPDDRIADGVRVTPRSPE